MKCLVTGGAGFIGSNLVDKLVAKKNKVIVFDDLSTGSASNLKKVRMVKLIYAPQAKSMLLLKLAL